MIRGIHHVALKCRGEAEFEEPHDITIPAEVPFPARIAFCKGPVGEKIEFFCEK